MINFYILMIFKCLLCKSLSLSVICSHCQQELLKPSIYTRVLPSGFRVYSFYKYSEISSLIKTKHTFIGYQIYKILAKNSFRKFAKNFSYSHKVYSISIDDRCDEFYSHTAILNRELKSTYIKPLYSKLRAKNLVTYSGTSLDHRLKNPRNFKYIYNSKIDVIIVDDIITTGTTINEAKIVIKNSGSTPLFALCLADAKEF